MPRMQPLEILGEGDLFIVWKHVIPCFCECFDVFFLPLFYECFLFPVFFVQLSCLFYSFLNFQRWVFSADASFCRLRLKHSVYMNTTGEALKPGSEPKARLTKKRRFILQSIAEETHCWNALTYSWNNTMECFNLQSIHILYIALHNLFIHIHTIYARIFRSHFTFFYDFIPTMKERLKNIPCTSLQVVVDLLKKQLTSPVLWEPSMQKMITVGKRAENRESIWPSRCGSGFQVQFED